MVDVYDIALASGAVLHYTGGDTDLVVNGVTYSAGGQIGPYFATKDNRAKAHWKIGKDVDTLTFDVLPGSALVGGLPWLQAIVAGVFDEAELTWSVVPMTTYGQTSAGAVVMFVGRIAEIDVRRSVAIFNVASHLELLARQFPRDVFQAGCINTLYDASCGLNAGNFNDDARAGAGSTASTILVNLTIATRPSGYYDLGKIVFISGMNAGIARSIKNWTADPGARSGSATLYRPFPLVPIAGDEFGILPGCDKQLATCSGKFNNQANHRAFPYVPTPETAV